MRATRPCSQASHCSRALAAGPHEEGQVARLAQVPAAALLLGGVVVGLLGLKVSVRGCLGAGVRDRVGVEVRGRVRVRVGVRAEVRVRVRVRVGSRWRALQSSSM